MRLIPMMIALAVLAFTGRIVAVYTEISPTLTPSVNAVDLAATQEDEQETPESDAEDAAEAGADGQAASGAGTPPLPSSSGFDFSDLATCTEEDMRLVDQLRQRRLVLDRRAGELDIRENLLAATEVRIQESTQQLVELEQQIKEHLKLFDDRQKKQLDRIVQVYSAMPAKAAAPKFESLSLDIQVDLATMMNPKKFADIVAKMDDEKAKLLTERLATIASAPTIDDVRGSR